MMEDAVAAGAALRRANAELRRYLDLVEVIVVAVNADGAIQIVNRRGCEILGYREEELLGRDWFALCVPPRLADERRALFRAMIARPPDEPAYNEYPVLTRSGVERTIAWRSVPLVDDAGRIVGLLRSGEDITDRRGLEEQFRQAQKMEAIGRLAGGVAHDFNNVLTAILGYCDLLKEDLRGNRAALEDVSEIRAAGERAARLTQQLLAFSRKQMVVPQVLDLNTVLQSTEKMLSRLIGEDVRLTIAPAPRVGRVKVDPGLVEQILLNLAVNARDAMPAGGELTISTSNATMDAAFTKRHVGSVAGDYAALTIRDTGVGMSPDVLQHIFEPFFTTKGQGKGTGLGLSTVYGIVKQSQGYITVESAPGAGTTFTIYLPRVSGRKTAPASRPAAPTTLMGGETILVVEDEPFVGAIIQKVLAPRGYRLLQARSAVEALAIEAAHNGPIDLLISDVVMADVSGPDLASRISALRPGIEVLFISGFIDHAAVDLEALSNSGAFLQKPFTAETLAAKVRQRLDARGSKPAHQSSSEPPNP
jgi:PAS domain S-box-containing protein